MSFIDAETIFVLYAIFFTSSAYIADDESVSYDVINDEISSRDPKNTYISGKCARECITGKEPKTCYYRFTIEQYSVLGSACGSCPYNLTDCNKRQCVTADGVERGILTVNRKLPGPMIQVCAGDRVIVDVRNLMPGRSTSIHWHGILQRGTPYMDGVPMVTQCPINENTLFRYDFIADKPGTHMWHSHDGFQKLDGLVGALIVKEPRTIDPSSSFYDHDLRSHVMVITDWMHLSGDQKFPGLRRKDPGQNSNSYLINGKGRYSTFGFLPAVDSVLQRKKLLSVQRQLFEPPTPLSEFRVSQGKRYRFRVISGTSLTCPVKLTIENHTMTLIAVDGAPVEPIYVDSIVMFSGERYDFVLEAIEPVSTYWIHVKGLGFCALEASYQVAILRYVGSPHKFPPSPDNGYVGLSKGEEVVLNPENAECAEGSRGICMSQLSSAVSLDNDILKEVPDVSITLKFGLHYFTGQELFQSGTYQRFLQPSLPVLVGATVNSYSFLSPPSPLLSQMDNIPKNLFCPALKNQSFCSGPDICECVHVIKVPLNAVVEFLLADKTRLSSGLNHAFHIHGFDFVVLAMGRISQSKTVNDIIEAYKKKELIKNDFDFRYPIIKDTLAIPSKGYAVVRIKADNPGYWLFHCHFVYHAIVGMAVIIQVGEQHEMPEVSLNFPKCGNFKPAVK